MSVLSGVRKWTYRATAALALIVPMAGASEGSPVTPDTFGAFRIRNNSNRSVSMVQAQGLRDGVIRLTCGADAVPAGGSSQLTCIDRGPQVIDAVVVQICTSPKDGLGLRGRYPDSAMTFGDRRIGSALAVVDADRMGGRLWIWFHDCSRISVPLEWSYVDCPKFGEDGRPAPLPGKGEGLLPSGAKDLEDNPFEKLDVENHHQNYPVVTTSARRYLAGQMRIPVVSVPYVRNHNGTGPGLGSSGLPLLNLAADKVCVEFTVNNVTYYARSPGIAPGLRVKTALVIVKQDLAESMVQFTYYSWGSSPVKVSTSPTCANLSLSVANGSAQPATANLYPGNTSVLQTVAAANTNESSVHAWHAGYPSLVLCLVRGGAATKWTLSAVSDGNLITRVAVTIPVSGDPAVAAHSWSGAAVTITGPTSGTCP